MHKARLRPAEDADSAGMIRLIDAIFAESPGCVLDVDLEEPELRSPASSFERCWVLDLDGETVGCGALAVHPGKSGAPMVEAKKIYVSRTLRRRGGGRALMEKVEEHARAIGAGALEIWTDTRFVEAHAFYERLGYRRTGRQRDLNDLSNTTEYHYRKLLREPGPQ